MKVPPETIERQPQARRLRTRDLRTIVGGGGVLVVGVDTPPTTVARAETRIGVVELPAPPSGVPDLAEAIAEAVVERLHAMGAHVTVTGANATLPTVTASSVSTPAPAPSTEVSDPPPLLLTTAMAARLLGCSVKALYHRVTERRIPSSCIVRSGRRLLFHRTRLLEAMDRRAGQR